MDLTAVVIKKEGWYQNTAHTARDALKVKVQ